MRSAAQLEGLPLNRSTLALLPDALVLTGRTRLFEPVRRTLSLHEVSRVETFDAEELVNLRVWAAAEALHLHVIAPVVWRFAIEDALRRLGRDLPAMGRSRKPGPAMPPGERSQPGGLAVPMPRPTSPASEPSAPEPSAWRMFGGETSAPGLPQVGDVVPVRLSVEMPGGVCIEVRLLGEVESVRSSHPGERHLAPGFPGSSGDTDPRGYVAPGDGHALDLPRLDVRL